VLRLPDAGRPCPRAGETADSEAIRKAISAFNDPARRAAVLAPGADVAPLKRLAGQEVSQVVLYRPMS